MLNSPIFNRRSAGEAERPPGALPLAATDHGASNPSPNAQRRRKRNMFAWRRWLVTGPIKSPGVRLVCADGAKVQSRACPTAGPALFKEV